MKAADQPCGGGGGGALHRRDRSSRPAASSPGDAFKARRGGSSSSVVSNGDQIEALFSKLRELVPSAGERRMSRTELLQSVIDYILDLSDALDAAPPPQLLQMEADAPCPIKTPLAERTDLNRMDALPPQVKGASAPASAV